MVRKSFTTAQTATPMGSVARSAGIDKVITLVTIDPDSRNIIQTIYLREVAKKDGRYINKKLKAFERQGEPGLAYISR